MYFVNGIKAELSLKGLGHSPNDDFQKMYAEMQAGGQAG